MTAPQKPPRTPIDPRLADVLGQLAAVAAVLAVVWAAGLGVERAVGGLERTVREEAEQTRASLAAQTAATRKACRQSASMAQELRTARCAQTWTPDCAPAPLRETGGADPC